MFTTFNFKNFSPTKTLEHYGYDAVTSLAGHTPMPLSCSGQLKARKTAGKTHYVCHLEILSGLGVFLQESASTDPRAAIDGAIFKLRQQMEAWVLRHFALSGANFMKLNKIKSRPLAAATFAS